MSKQEMFDLVEEFVQENRQRHYRIAYSYVRNEQDALDIVQEATLKALRSIDRLREVRYLKTWFYRILVNTALDFIRKHGRVTLMEDDTIDFFLPSEVNHPENVDLQKAIYELEPMYQTVIILRFFEDLKLSEIAKITDVNLNTVKTRLYTALRQLRVEMGEEYI